MQAKMIHGKGRRKSSTSRVWMKPGSGKVTVNDKPLTEYFTVAAHSAAVLLPLHVTDNRETFDIEVNVSGGGITGQSDATKLGISRALVEFDKNLRAILKPLKLLAVDQRKVERKKPGQKKARRKFQFVKR